jgi:hypothetical protein
MLTLATTWSVEVMRISAHALIHALDVDLEADIVCFKLYHQHGTFFYKKHICDWKMLQVEERAGSGG